MYKKPQVRSHMKFVHNNMYGLLPVYERERAILDKFAQDQQVDLRYLLSMRNQLRIQSEVTSKRQSSEMIANKFYSKENMPIISCESVKKFCAELRQPIHHVVKSVAADPRYSQLDIDSQKCIFQPINDVIEIEKKSKLMSRRFEERIEDLFRSQSVPFLTEKEIIERKLFDITPDILFEKPIALTYGSNTYEIKWIDAKNFVYMGDFVPFFKAKIIKQAQKYLKTLGPGAIVFRYGMVEDKTPSESATDLPQLIPGVYMIDWRQMVTE